MSYKEELLSKTKAELVDIATEYGIEVGDKVKAEIADDIIRFETGVGPEAEIGEAKKEEPKKEEGKLLLVKFTGRNNTFQVGKYTFQKDNPFLAVPERVANHVFKVFPNVFRPATPEEVQRFYS